MKLGKLIDKEVSYSNCIYNDRRVYTWYYDNCTVNAVIKFDSVLQEDPPHGTGGYMIEVDLLDVEVFDNDSELILLSNEEEKEINDLILENIEY